jgi:hypothetical protein
MLSIHLKYEESIFPRSRVGIPVEINKKPPLEGEGFRFLTDKRYVE